MSPAGFDRLRKARDFQNAYRRGRRQQGQLVRVFCCANGLDHLRIGITITRKCGSAVRRNRLRRQMRECLRVASMPYAGRPFDLVVHALPQSDPPTYRQIAVELGRLLGRALGEKGRG